MLPFNALDGGRRFPRMIVLVGKERKAMKPLKVLDVQKVIIVKRRDLGFHIVSGVDRLSPIGP